MRWFHRHDWAVLRSTYAPPSQAANLVWEDWAREKAIHGCTTFLLKCSGCPATRTHVLLGKQVEEAWTPPGIKVD